MYQGIIEDLIKASLKKLSRHQWRIDQGIRDEVVNASLKRKKDISKELNEALEIKEGAQEQQDKGISVNKVLGLVFLVGLS